MPQGKPLPGEIYRHFKNKTYQVVAVATHSETREPMVVYQALYGDFRIYVRPYDMFVSPVDRKKYPDVSQEYRFALVGTVSVTEEPAQSPEPETKGAVAWETQTAGEPEAGEKEEPEPETGESREDVSQVDPKLLAFLETEDFEEKYKILCSMEREITDHLINQFAATLDVVIPEGDLADRFDQLKICVRTRSRFESRRLR